jgi:hypothetical protein
MAIIYADFPEMSIEASKTAIKNRKTKGLVMSPVLYMVRLK